MTARLLLDTAPVLKKNSITEVRTDGESFSFKLEIDGLVFGGASFFGNKVAQGRMRDKIINGLKTAQVKQQREDV
jgi:hypothetical protein